MVETRDVSERQSTRATAQDPAKGTAALSKGLAILTSIAEAEDPLTVRELSQQTGVPRPTVYRLLAALTEAGLVRAEATGHTYQLGTRLITIAHRALSRTDIRDIAHEHLLRLRDETGETVHLAVQTTDGMLYVDNIESHERVRMRCSLGVTVPMHSTAVGKAYLAFSPDAERERVLARLQIGDTPAQEVEGLARLLQEIADTRQRGWAVDEEENERDIFCFGAPIIDRAGTVVASVSVSVPRFRMRADTEEVYVAPLLRIVAGISKMLGHESQARGAFPSRRLASVG